MGGVESRAPLAPLWAGAPRSQKLPGKRLLELQHRGALGNAQFVQQRAARGPPVWEAAVKCGGGGGGDREREH